MQLTVFNGSGRGKQGNTVKLVEPLLKGFTSVEGNTYQIHTLMQIRKQEEHTAAFTSAEHVLMAFPMYTDMVPGVVKDFLETLQPFCGREENPSIGFLIHCGFPEAVQLRALERYLEKLARRLGCRHTGTILKGNSEGMRETPPEKMTDLLSALEALGRSLALDGTFDAAIIQSLAQPERFSPALGLLFRVLALTPLMNGGWDRDLKSNDAYDKRHARPYLREDHRHSSEE
jgi:hypothetical protein